jgi:hypothetical protein
MLVAAGVAPEDARNVIPLGATHRMVWTLNLHALLNIFKKRTCWIAQLGLWEDVLYGMLEELEKTGLDLGPITSPPCYPQRDECWGGCAFRKENVARMQRNDPGLPCPLFLFRDKEGKKRQGGHHYKAHYADDAKMQVQLAGFEQLWCRRVEEAHDSRADGSV